MTVVVTVMPKRSVLDPQGAALAQAMEHLGFDAKEVRIGKSIVFQLPDSAGSMDEAKLHGLCRDLLSNPVIEDYDLKIVK